MSDIDMVHQNGQTMNGDECPSRLPLFRKGTSDEWVWRSVVEGNEYFLPEAFLSTDLIVDVGLHIGSFSYLVLTRGAGEVFGYEADVDNYNLAKANLQDFAGRVSIINAAVCRSDVPPRSLFFSGYEVFKNNNVNTGGGDVLWSQQGKEVMTVAFDHIVDAVTGGGKRRIRVLKLDCEGSEYPILMTSQRLHLVDEIVGEFHEIGCGHDNREVPPTAQINGVAKLCGETLADFLSSQGFAVRIGGKGHIWGKFLAWNTCALSSVLGDGRSDDI